MLKKTFVILFLFTSLFSNGQIDTLNYQFFLKKKGLSSIETIYNYDDAVRLINLWNGIYPREKARIYSNISAYRWEKILKFNIQEALNENNVKLAGKLSYPLAILYHRQTKYNISTPLLIELIKYKQELKREQLKEAYSRLESSYRATGQFSEALKIRRIRLNLGFINNLWELYKIVGLYKEAIQDFKLFEKFPENDDFEKIRYYNKIGELYLEVKYADSAIFYFNKMKKAADYIITHPAYSGKTNYSEYVKYYYKAIANANISEGNVVKKQYLTAIPNLKKAVVLCKKIKEVDQKIIKWLDLAECYLGLNKIILAKAYLDSSKISMSNKRMLPYELKLLKLTAICNQRLGNSKGYITYMSTYLNLKDSVLTINKNNQSTLLLMNVDVEHQKMLLASNRRELTLSKQAQNHQKKIIFYTIACIVSLLIILLLLYKNYRIQVRNKKEIAIQNAELIKNEIQINQQAEEKEMLIKEIHHRVKNNLQLIYSLLNLQKRRVQSEKVKQKLSALQNRIKSMALVHQQLYVDTNLKEIMAATYIENLVSHLKNIYTQEGLDVKIQYEMDKIYLPLEKAIPIGLIINEAVSNVFKYAFQNRKKGVLTICFIKKEKDTYELMIKDNGIGFDSYNIKPSCLGMQLIENMAKQLKSTYFCVSDNGTIHQFNFTI